MKKFLFTTAAFIFATATLTAQQHYVAYSGKSFDGHIKKSTAFKSASMALLERRNTKAYEDFTAKFGVEVDANIITEPNNTIVVFNNAGILTRVYYKSSGLFSGTIRYYDASGLPVDITNTITSTFSGYAIAGVTELACFDEKTAYLVKIENDKSWKTVQVVDGQTTITEQYKKSK